MDVQRERVARWKIVRRLSRQWRERVQQGKCTLTSGVVEEFNCYWPTYTVSQGPVRNSTISIVPRWLRAAYVCVLLLIDIEGRLEHHSMYVNNIISTPGE